VELRFPGHEEVEWVEAEGVRLPRGWEVKPIGEVVETTGGGTPSTQNPEYWEGGNIVWYVPSDLTATNSMFIFDSGKHITPLGLQKSSARLFPSYSVMMTSRATIGVTAINTTEACTNQGFITCIPNARISAYQILFWIEENLPQILTLASGATFKEITKTTFRELPILVPSQSIADKFLEVSSPIGRQIETLLRKNELLREARDLLLPRLISGELDVSELELSPDVSA
jgi:type I restriction enzyme S subunit